MSRTPKTITFVEALPPKNTNGPRASVWRPVIEELKASPDRWALMGSSVAPSLATYLRKLDPNVRASTRSLPNDEQGRKRADVYAMFSTE